MSSKRMTALAALLILSPVAAAQATLRWTVGGLNPDDQFGISCELVGDVDGDGFADVIIGAIADEVVPTATSYAQVISGATGQLIWQFTAEGPGDLFGLKVGGAGDVDADGYEDLIVGAPRNDSGGTNAGRAYVYSGRTGTVLYTKTGEAPFDNLGDQVHTAGDVNRDGYDDFIIGARNNDSVGTNAGRIYVYSGATGLALYVKNGEFAGDRYGSGVGPAGDMNADGYADFLVGALENDAGGINAGAAYAYSGATGALLHKWTGTTLTPAPQGDEMGTSLEGIGDINGDGYDDVAVSAKETSGSAAFAGRVYVYSGATYLPIYILEGEAANDQFGDSTRGAGDVDGDGVPDILVGSRHPVLGPLTGRAYVYSGASGTLLFTIDGANPGDLFAHSVSGAGDMNGDGLSEIVVGAYLNDQFGTDAGIVYAYSPPGSGVGGPMLNRVARGNVVNATGDTVDILTINGSSGGGPRRVDLAVGSTVTFGMAQPPLNPQPAGNAVFLWLGIPTAVNVTALPLGIGAMAFTPCPLDPNLPGTTLVDTFGVSPCVPLLPAAPTPWLSAPAVLPIFPINVTLQAVVEAAPGQFRVSNGVILRSF